MGFDAEEAKKNGWSQEEINAYLAKQGTSTAKTSSPKSTLQNIVQSPLIPWAGAAMGATAGIPLAPLTVGGSIPFGGFAGYTGASTLQKNLEQLLGFTNRTAQQETETVGNTFTGGLNAAALAELINVIPWITKAGTLSKSRSAVTKATEEGVRIPTTEVYEAQKKTATSKLGTTPEVTKTLEDLASEPASASQDYFTPTELLDWRQQIARRGGSSFFKKMWQGESVPEKTTGLARSGASGVLHEYVPETKIPDILYSKYSGKLGSPVEAVFKLGLSLLGYGTAYSAIRGIFSGMGAGSSVTSPQ